MNAAPVSAWVRVFDAIMALLAAVGMIALAGLVGLYYGGFFHFLATRHKDSAVLQFFFGST